LIELVYETHSLTTDNEAGIATGWIPGLLSERGRAAAQALGERRRDDGIEVVFTSDLRRAVARVLEAEESEGRMGDEPTVARQR